MRSFRVLSPSLYFLKPACLSIILTFIANSSAKFYLNPSKTPLFSNRS